MRFFVMFIMAFLALTIQSTILPYLRLGGTMPDLILILAVSFALLRGSLEGAVLGFAIGFLEDVFLGSLLGVNALSKMTICYLVGLVEEKVYKENLLVSVTALVAATFLDNIFVFLFYKFFGVLPDVGFWNFNKVLWPAMFYNCFLAPFIYLRLYTWLAKPKPY